MKAHPVALAAVSALLVVAGAQVAAQSTASDCDNCGQVQSIRMTSAEATGWRPLGTVNAGSLGDMDSPSRTTTALSIGRPGTQPTVVTIGAAGGVAYAKQPRAYQQPRWEIVVRMDRGEPRTIQTSYDPLLQEGDRVRVYGTQLERIATP